MTPDPITTARQKTIEMSEELYEFYPAMSAQNHADEVRKYAAQVTAPLLAELEKLKAERDEFAATIVTLAEHRNALTSQLEQAERVIGPLYFDSTNVPFAIPDRRPLWMRADNGKYVELLHTTVGTLRAASQWIKDRQAKTDTTLAQGIKE